MAGRYLVNYDSVDEFFNQYFNKPGDDLDELYTALLRAQAEFGTLGSETNAAALEVITKFDEASKMTKYVAEATVLAINKCSQRFLLQELLIKNTFNSTASTGSMSCENVSTSGDIQVPSFTH